MKIQFMVLGNITCCHDYAIFGQLTADLTGDNVCLCIANLVTTEFYGPIFIRPFEKRSYYVITLGVRLSIRPSVNFFVSVLLLLQFTSELKLGI